MKNITLSTTWKKPKDGYELIVLLNHESDQLISFHKKGLSLGDETDLNTFYKIAPWLPIAIRENKSGIESEAIAFITEKTGLDFDTVLNSVSCFITFDRSNPTKLAPVVELSVYKHMNGITEKTIINWH